MDEIAYSDGTAIEASLLALVRQEKELASTAAPGASRYDEWPVRYHLSPERANLLRHLDFTGLDVLELGAGMGAVSRLLAERARSLTVVEGTRARYEVLESRLRDLKNWTGSVSNLERADVPGTFDVVCVIGVLEYSELYLSPPPEFTGSPFAWMIAQAKAWLRPGGALILAIENKLGLKYWAGSAEDHTGRIFDGICGYPEGRSARTFSRPELKRMLQEAGLTAVEEQFPFPDYKIPSSVLSLAAIERHPELAAGLAASRPSENYGPPNVKLFPELLAARNLSYSGLLPEMANSFLFLASDTADSPTLARLLGGARQQREIAWHYALSRKAPVVTAFRERGDGTAVADKRLLDIAREVAAPAEGALNVRWSPAAETPVSTDVPLRTRLASLAYFEDGEGCRKLLVDFLKDGVRRWKTRDEGVLWGKALDALVTNAVVLPDGTFDSFDLEWTLDEDLPASWYVLRNVLALAPDLETLAVAPFFTTLEQLYVQLCEELSIAPELEKDLEREISLLAAVTSLGDPAVHRARLEELLRRPCPAGRLARRPEVKDESLKATLLGLPRRIAGRALREAREPELIKRGLRWIFRPPVNQT